MWQDLRYGARMLMKKPGFSLIAILMLALGIGANTAIFTVVDAALLRSLPYKAPERLYPLWEATPQQEFAQREFSTRIFRIINKIGFLKRSQRTGATPRF